METTTVQTRRSRYSCSALRSAAPVSVVLDSYPSRRPTGGNPKVTGRNTREASELLPARSALARYRIALGRDTIALDTVPLRTEVKESPAGTLVSYTGTVGGRPLALNYAVAPDSFLLHVSANVTESAGSALLVGLPRTMRSNEPDTLDDIRHLAVSYRLGSGDIESVGLLEARFRPRPIGVPADPLDRDAQQVFPRRLPRAGQNALQRGPAARWAPVRQDCQRRDRRCRSSARRGRTGGFDIYAGPQDFERFQKLGSDLDQVNPYGGFMRGLVQPFAVIVMRVLLWIKRTTQLNYGWVLVLFGVIIRLALWPLNQSAMRTSLKMQRLQPELQALQKRYSDDPRKQQEAIMKVYKDHGMSPLSPLMGCLPMLLPMPILFALYFVFQNTIEFRGVPFLWLPDISLKDPFYITPVLMGVSMFVMTWIGSRNMPPNPQAKMMMYMMPVMLTFFFLNLASGLNLYYAVQNVAAIPQQWLLARERAKEPAPAPVVRGMPAPAQKRRS